MAKGRGGRKTRGEEYQRNRRILEQMKGYGLDPEDFDDFVALGERPGELYTGGMEGLVPVAPYRVDDGRSAAWDKRLKELQDRAKKRREAKRQREIEDYDATIRGKETPTQAEIRKAAEATQTGGTQTAGTQPTGTQPTGTQPTGTQPVGPAGGSGEPVRPQTRKGVIGGVGTDANKRGTLEVNGMRMTPSTENKNLVAELHRRQLTDNLNPRLTDSVVTNAELRQFQRENGQIALDRARWARRDEILKRGRELSDKISWDRGEVRNARDWEHYGTVASAEGWKKGSDEYNSSMTALRDKMKTLQGMADAGYMPSTGKAMAEFSKLIEGSDAGAGLTQKQVEVANKQLDSWLSGAQNRQARVEAGNAYRMNRLREDLGLAEGTSDSAVLKADQDRRNSAINGALITLGNPETWDSPDYYAQLETLQRNGAGLASAFSSAMKDPAMREAYNADVQRLRSTPNSDVDLAELQNKYAVVGLQRQRGLGELNLRASPVRDMNDPVLDDTGAPIGQEQVAIQPKIAPQQTLADKEKRRLGIQAAQGAGDALRPRRKGVL